MVTAFTDGTKLQVEQALIGNHAGATIAAPGLLGPAAADWRAAALGLAEAARRLGRPVADYVLCPGAPHGVFLIAGHDGDEAPALDYFKLGPGPDYLLLKPNIFVHLEVPRTIRRVVEQGRGLLDNSAAPTLGVAAVAKRRVEAGTRVPTGIGGWDFRGLAIRLEDIPDHVPIGLLQDAVVTRRLEPGELPTMADVDLPDSRALRAWLDLRGRRWRTESAGSRSPPEPPSDLG
jgi:predicted homoserine dehydrogenase-like protein